MSDNTTKRPTIQDSDLHDDTVIYRACAPRVRAVEINVLEEIATILNFRPSGLRVAREIIKRQHGENITISCTDAELAAALWPDLPEAARLKKAVRAKQYLTEDQSNSNFRYIWKVPRQVEQNKDGSYYGLPSKYRPGDYWSVSDELQFRSNEQGHEFLSMSAYGCRQMERELLTEILGERECKKIVRLRKKKNAKDSKEKSAPLPCKCDCSSCVECLAKKSATGSEANERGRVDELRRKPNENFGAELDAFTDRYYLHLCEFGEVGKEFRYEVKHVLHAMEVAEIRAREMITTENKREDTRQYIKLIGGQSK